MTSSHFIFIPAVLILGIFVGFLVGSRAAADRVNLERKRDEEREKARKARQERLRKRKAAEGEAEGKGEGGKGEEKEATDKESTA